MASRYFHSQSSGSSRQHNGNLYTTSSGNGSMNTGNGHMTIHQSDSAWERRTEGRISVGEYRQNTTERQVVSQRNNAQQQLRHQQQINQRNQAEIQRQANMLAQARAQEQRTRQQEIRAFRNLEIRERRMEQALMRRN
ncbi:hypothetical protein GQ53DRAFT_815198 [Thozetella sp. PMI_491]|nr:hypothetical protein GQ53DRAFT_815198 [Thozetella sp. PMI_491]